MIDTLQQQLKKVGTALAILLVSLSITSAQAPDQQPADENPSTSSFASHYRLVLVIGAEGEPEYGKQFSQWAQSWQQIARDAGWQWLQIGGPSEPNANDLERLKQEIDQWSQSADASNMSYVLVLVGHGTAQKGEAKFNLRGPDLSAKDLAKWLAAVPSQVVVINNASASSPFINALSGNRRIIVTATKSEQESNFCRFGEYLPQALLNPESDLDHDDQVSLVEAVIHAANRTREFYESEGRIQTEHALLDDNGDTRGSPAEALAAMMRGESFEMKPDPSSSKNRTPIARSWDGVAAARLVFPNLNRAAELDEAEEAKRTELEDELARVRQSKTSLEEAEYFHRLEQSLVKLAEFYEEVDKRQEKETKSP